MTKKKYYVASRASIPERAEMWLRFRDKGVDIVSSWIDEAGEGQTEDFSELWTRIQREIASCDTLVFYAEKDDFPLKGAFVEVGMALGLGKTVTVVMPNYKPEGTTSKPIGSWINHPSVRIIKNVYNAFDHYVITHRASKELYTSYNAPDSWELRECDIEYRENYNESN